MDFIRIYAELKQNSFKKIFQIKPLDWTFHFPGLAKERPVEKIPTDVAVEMCNNLYRLLKNIDFAKEKLGGRESRKMQRSATQIQKILSSNDVEMLDLTGQPFVVGRNDFEIVGEPEVNTQISEPTITFCERPAVMVGENLVQTARGIVSIPPK